MLVADFELTKIFIAPKVFSEEITLQLVKDSFNHENAH